MNAHRKKFVRTVLGLLIAVSPFATIGCGGNTSSKPTGSAKIHIVFDGSPVTEGRVNLQSATSGEGGGGDLDKSGTAYLNDVAIGSYIVTVTPIIVPLAPTEPGKPAQLPKDLKNIPEKFRRADRSPLKADIGKTATEVTFDLKKL